MINRPRRLRYHPVTRDLIREIHVKRSDLIYPMFLVDGKNIKEEIKSMPNQFRYSLDKIIIELKDIISMGIKAIALFPAVEEKHKTSKGEYSFNSDNFYLKAVKEIKSLFPDLWIMSDIALDPYSSDGHDGIVCPKTGEILNDETLEIFSKMAIAQAQAGFDFLGPSDMMDGRIKHIRKSLDSEGFYKTGIISYCTKYASSFYGPFRDALDSTPKFGDKKTYQMDYSNSRDALIETKLDAQEGADILMVKPAQAYMDILYRMKQSTDLPLACYHVSGSYSMIKAGSLNGWIDEEGIVKEVLTGFKRAGANMILTYFARDFALNEYDK